MQQTGANNPLNMVAIGYYSFPSFVDIDGDGDQDAFIGTGYGMVLYYKNTGTASAPVFTQQNGIANPLNMVALSNGVSPTFADIDGDGDKDAFIGLYDGTIIYYKNTGTASAPVFALQPDAANPFYSINNGTYASLAFVDIDGDGDLDAFIGTATGTIFYYKNTGTATAPAFALEIGANNPLDIVSVGAFSAPSFADIDGDGDMDLIVGASDGSVSYYKNTGTATAPVFTVQIGAANPFNGVTVGTYAIPRFVDIDNDGDFDVFIGNYDGTVSYYKNTTPLLPLHLISFSGTRQAGYNHLQWQTADEVNTKLFEIEQSTNGTAFTKIATVNSAGTSNSSYSINDNSFSNGKVFYRLKIIDIDGKFTYSPVIWINSEQTGGVSIYPNPVRGLLNLNIGNAAILKTNAWLFDANGRLMKIILINNNQQQINVQDLAKGTYIIKFADHSSLSFIKR